MNGINRGILLVHTLTGSSSSSYEILRTEQNFDDSFCKSEEIEAQESEENSTDVGTASQSIRRKNPRNIYAIKDRESQIESDYEDYNSSSNETQCEFKALQNEISNLKDNHCYHVSSSRLTEEEISLKNTRKSSIKIMEKSSQKGIYIIRKDSEEEAIIVDENHEDSEEELDDGLFIRVNY